MKAEDNMNHNDKPATAPETGANEALAEKAKGGDMDALAALWAQNRRLLWVLGRQYYFRYEQQAVAAGVTLEDVEQEGYFITCRAVALYDPARGAYNTLLGLIARGHLQRLFGMRKAGGRGDPLNRAASLDEPVAIGEAEGDTLGELVPDPEAEAALLDTDERLYTQQLHNDLEATMEQIPSHQADTLRKVYWQGYSFRQLAESMGCSTDRARATEYAALAALRRKARHLRAYQDEIRTAHAYRGTGFGAWAHRGSVEERLVERQEEKERRLAAANTKHLAELLDLDVAEPCGLLDE